MKFSTLSFRKKRKSLVKQLIKYEIDEAKYIKIFKQIQKVYYKYKMKKYKQIDIIDKLLSDFLHSHKLKTLKDIQNIIMISGYRTSSNV